MGGGDLEHFPASRARRTFVAYTIMFEMLLNSLVGLEKPGLAPLQSSLQILLALRSMPND